MAQFRVETVEDVFTGLIYAEIYFPDDAATPSATTKPLFSSHEEAAAAVIEAFKKAQPNHPVKVKR